MLYEEKQIETIPVGPLGLIPLKSCAALGKKVDEWLVGWRHERESEHKTTSRLRDIREILILSARERRDLEAARLRVNFWSRFGATICT